MASRKAKAAKIVRAEPSDPAASTSVEASVPAPVASTVAQPEPVAIKPTDVRLVQPALKSAPDKKARTETRTRKELKPSIRNLERVEGWGMAVHSYSNVFRPREADEIRDAFDFVRRTGRKLALRGGGCSYGDASILHDGVVLDLTQMNRILSWDSKSGLIEIEPGVTLQQLWQTIISSGWWPPVVSGTMFTTIGGCCSMNIHGKNNFKVGPFGNHVLEFDLLLPSGELLTCSREKNSTLFHGAISGFGMLGCFTRIKMKMKKLHSGLLRVEAFETENIQAMANEFEQRYKTSDYLVGWVDGMPGGKKLGRGLIHRAMYLNEGEDPRPTDRLNVTDQGLPDKLFGVLPKSMMHLLMGPFVNNAGARLVNAAKFWSRWIQPRGHCYFQSHAAFAFLLDFVPNWKWAYKPVGLIQYQPFIPKDNAVAAFEQIFRRAQKANLPPYLGVFKKHQPDPFLLTHAVDGYSMAMDFRVTNRNRAKLWALTRELDEIVLDAGGRFYFAKDSTLQADRITRFFPRENLQTFLDLKRKCDPDNLLQTELSRRLFSSLFENGISD